MGGQRQAVVHPAHPTLWIVTPVCVGLIYNYNFFYYYYYYIYHHTSNNYNYNNLLSIIHLHHSLWPCYRCCLCLPLHLLWDHLRVLHGVDLRGENQGSKWCSTKVDSQGVHVNGEGNYGFCGTDCNIDTVSLADILESLIGANARTSSQRNKDSVVFGNTAGRPK